MRWSIILFLLWYSSLDHHNTAQPDAWAGVMMTGAFALIVAQTRLSTISGFVSGVLIGYCALIKPTYLLFLALPLLDGWCHVRAEGVGRTVRFWLASGVGLLLPIVLCISWFWYRGALDDWIAVHLRWIPSSYVDVDAAWLNRGQYLLAFLTTERFAPAVPLAIGGLWLVCMLAFEVGLGRALGASWSRLAADYDPAQGGFMLFGMAVLLLAPTIAGRIRDPFPPTL